MIVVKRARIHVSDIKGVPIEVESLDIIDGMFEKRVARSGDHERIVETNGETRRGYPVNGEEEIHWLEALYIKIEVYAAQFVENKVSDCVRALNLYSSRR